MISELLLVLNHFLLAINSFLLCQECHYGNVVKKGKSVAFILLKETSNLLNFITHTHVHP